MSLIRFSDEIDDSGVEMMPATSLDHGLDSMDMSGDRRFGHTRGAKSEPFSVRLTEGATRAPVFDSYLSDESDCPFSTDEEATGVTRPTRHKAQPFSRSSSDAMGGRKYLNRSLLGQGDKYDLEAKVFVFPSTWTSKPNPKPKPKTSGDGIGFGNWSFRGRTFSSSTTSTVASSRNCSRSPPTTQKPEKIRRHESWIESLRGRMNRSKTSRSCNTNPARRSGSLTDDAGYWGEVDEASKVSTAEVRLNAPKAVARPDEHRPQHRQCTSEVTNFSRSDITFVAENDNSDAKGVSPAAQPPPARQQQFFLPHHCSRGQENPFADQTDNDDPYY